MILDRVIFVKLIKRFLELVFLLLPRISGILLIRWEGISLDRVKCVDLDWIRNFDG
jgi:hypothetical protein